VKLLLLDEEERLLLIRAEDLRTHAKCWYPVGGGVEPRETLQEAAAREAFEETGLVSLPPGRLVWQRDHTYEFNGRVMDVHEKWLMHAVEHFDPKPANLSEDEADSILGFRWWHAAELIETTETVFPPQLGRLLQDLLADCVPAPELRGDVS
jgi:8-oxo-dGTP pyrophosphatase MutT (NUDIX family)